MDARRTKFYGKTAVTATIMLTMAIYSLSTDGAHGKKDEDVKKERYLLLDSRVVANTQNAQLTLGVVEKHPSNPLFGEDEPWEKRYDNLYARVIYDEEEQLYKCWYTSPCQKLRFSSFQVCSADCRDSPLWLSIQDYRHFSWDSTGAVPYRPTK